MCKVSFLIPKVEESFSRMKAVVAGVQKLRCLCGLKISCAYCNNTHEPSCGSPIRTHCPACGNPFCEPLNNKIKYDTK